MQKSWKNESRHSTFKSADEKRKTLIEKNNDDFLVKVKFMSSENCFVVKTWTPPTTPPKKAKVESDKGKGKPRSKSQKRALREKKKQERESK